MREYARIAPTFWTGRTGKLLRGHLDAQVVAAYLLTAPSANMIGVYYLPIPIMAHELGMTLEGASKGLRRVCESGFAQYDQEQEMVFVPEMARYQIGETLSRKDKRVKGVVQQLRVMKKSRFVLEFYDKYVEAFVLDTQLDRRELEGYSDSPSEGPSMGLRSKEKEKEQDSSSSPSSPPSLNLVRPKKEKSQEKDDADAALFKQVVDRWNTIPGVKPVQAVAQGMAAKELQGRVAGLGRSWDWWEQLMDRVKASDFLCGRKTDFRVSLFWITGPKNLKKLQLGEYDNWTGPVLVKPAAAGASYNDVMEE